MSQKRNYPKKTPGTFAKKSGCTLKQLKALNKDNQEVKYWVMFGWNSSKQGLMKFIASPKKQGFKVNEEGDKIAIKTSCVTAHGEVREIWVCKVTFPSKEKKLYTGFFDPANKVLRIPELEMTANPNTPAGKTSNGKTVSGYWGRNYVK